MLRLMTGRGLQEAHLHHSCVDGGPLPKAWTRWPGVRSYTSCSTALSWVGAALRSRLASGRNLRTKISSSSTWWPAWMFRRSCWIPSAAGVLGQPVWWTAWPPPVTTLQTVSFPTAPLVYWSRWTFLRVAMQQVMIRDISNVVLNLRMLFMISCIPDPPIQKLKPPL